MQVCFRGYMKTLPGGGDKEKIYNECLESKYCNKNWSFEH